MYDLLIRTGTIVDGTGADARRGDVAVKDGKVVSVGEHLDGEAAEVVDAEGRLVTPGFVDIHTHYDGQATWDEVLDPSAGHGVTTVVAGNCGVGFAPGHPGPGPWLIPLKEGGGAKPRATHPHRAGQKHPNPKRLVKKNTTSE